MAACDQQLTGRRGNLYPCDVAAGLGHPDRHHVVMPQRDTLGGDRQADVYWTVPAPPTLCGAEYRLPGLILYCDRTPGHDATRDHRAQWTDPTGQTGTFTWPVT